MGVLTICSAHSDRCPAEEPGILRKVLILLKEMNNRPGVDVERKEEQCKTRNNEKHDRPEKKAGEKDGHCMPQHSHAGPSLDPLNFLKPPVQVSRNLVDTGI